MGTPGVGPHFQRGLVGNGRLGAMHVHVEPLPDHPGPEARAHQAATLAKYVKDVVGVTAKIVVNDPGGVPRSQGKAIRIIDKRSKA